MTLTLSRSTASPTPRSLRRCSRLAATSLLVALAATGCKHAETNKDAAEAPGHPAVTEIGGSSTVHMEHPNLFSLVTTGTANEPTLLQVTGQVTPDVSREIPVLSLANGRVIALRVGLGDYVHQGQPVMDVQSPDVSTAFDAYLKAVNDERLARTTLDRDKLLFDKGAIPQTQLEAAQNADDDAKTDLAAAEQQLRILGVDKNHPADVVHIAAPISGVVVQQNTTASGVAGITYAGNNGSLLIADLSHVWVLCDVYENDLANVHLGQHVAITLNAFPNRTFDGTISDIGAVLDPNLRTAKVRVQVANPGNVMRLGMFATASIETAQPHAQTVVPATAVLQLHDRSYVFVPTNQDGLFRRVYITTGKMLSGNQLEVLTGLAPGQQVVSNALDMQNSADQ